MKTYIKKPEKVTIGLLSKDPLNAKKKGLFDDLESSICANMEKLSDRIGCTAPDASVLCAFVENLAVMFGCGEFECDANGDCDEPKVCTNHKCVLPSGACEEDADCDEELETCVDDECKLKEDKCRAKSDCVPDEGMDVESCEDNECEYCKIVPTSCESDHECCDGLACLPSMEVMSEGNVVKKLVLPKRCCVPSEGACSNNAECCSNNCHFGECGMMPI